MGKKQSSGDVDRYFYSSTVNGASPNQITTVSSNNYQVVPYFETKAKGFNPNICIIRLALGFMF